MAKDAYGNDVVDPFDLAIAQGVMRSTWFSAGFALGVNLLGGCCFGVGTMVSPLMMLVPVLIVALLSIGSAINVAIRVFTMQPEHKSLVPSWHPWGALGLAVAGAGWALTQGLLTIVYFWMISSAVVPAPAG